jgi:hypothetical protein
MKTIQQLIDETLIRPDRERSGKWNPSSFGRCYRQQFWNRKNEPKSNPPDERDVRVMAAGQLFHDFVQNILCKKDDLVNYWEREALVESEDVKGYADIVGENEVVDIKSQHSKSFWYMSKFKGEDIKKEKYANWLQVGYYARELGKKFMRLVFVSKDDLCIQEYVQPLDEYWLNEIDCELKMLRGLWIDQILPSANPRCEPKTNKKKLLENNANPAEITYWECQYCNWKDKCFKLEGKE